MDHSAAVNELNSAATEKTEINKQNQPEKMDKYSTAEKYIKQPEDTFRQQQSQYYSLNKAVKNESKKEDQEVETSKIDVNEWQKTKDNFMIINAPKLKTAKAVLNILEKQFAEAGKHKPSLEKFDKIEEEIAFISRLRKVLNKKTAEHSMRITDLEPKSRIRGLKIHKVDADTADPKPDNNDGIWNKEFIALGERKKIFSSPESFNQEMNNRITDEAARGENRLFVEIPNKASLQYHLLTGSEVDNNAPGPMSMSISYAPLITSTESSSANGLKQVAINLGKGEGSINREHVAGVSKTYQTSVRIAIKDKFFLFLMLFTL